MFDFFEKLLAWICPNRRQQDPSVQQPADIAIPENGDGIDDALRLPSEEDTSQQTAVGTKGQDPESVDNKTEENIALTEITPVEGSTSKDAKSTEGPVTLTPNQQQKTEQKTVSAERMIKLTVDTIRIYDAMSKQVPDSDQRVLLEDVCNSLVENLIIAGCSPVGEEQGFFNIAYHRTSPLQIVEDGTPYSKLIRKGVMYNGEVKLLAIVEL